MKKIFSILAVMVLSTAFLACDFGSDDEDTTTPGDDTYTPRKMSTPPTTPTSAPRTCGSW